MHYEKLLFASSLTAFWRFLSPWRAPHNYSQHLCSAGY
jgi:hypothetical protein